MRDGNILRWEDGTTLDVKQGAIVSLDPEGYHDEKVVGRGKLRLKDPLPMTYPLVTARPRDGRLVIEVRQGAGRRPTVAQTGRKYYTDARLAIVRSNLEKYDWARKERSEILAEADRWAGYDDERLRTLVVPPQVPQAPELALRHHRRRQVRTADRRYRRYEVLIPSLISLTRAAGEDHRAAGLDGRKPFASER